MDFIILLLYKLTKKAERLNWYFLIFIVCFYDLCLGQNVPGVRQIAQSHSACAASGDVFDLYTNEALVVPMRSPQFGFFYSPAPFGMNELKSIAAAAVYPYRGHVIGAALRSYGFELYRQLNAKITYASKIAGTLNAGISAELVNISIKNYGTNNTVLVNAGASYGIFRGLNWGVSIRNLTHAKIGVAQERLPAEYTTGLCFRDYGLQVNGAVSKEGNFDPSFNFGITYAFNEYFELLSGYTTYPALFSCGTCVTFKGFTLQYAVTNHTLLGYSHYLGMLISFTEGILF